MLAGCGPAAAPDAAPAQASGAAPAPSIPATRSRPSADPAQASSATAYEDDSPARPPERVLIPSIRVDASVVAVGLTPSGQMEVPDFGLAGWYTEGPVPGDPGPGVVIAHVSSRRGPDVFARLAELRPGDLVTVRATDGVERSWAVVATEQADKDDLPTGRIWNGTTQAVLRLITCAGSIDPDTGHYEDNWIVYADPVATDV